MNVPKQNYITTELCCIYDERADGAIFRSEIRWIESGEKSTKYFFDMERKNYNKKTIKILNVVVTDLKILK